MSSFTTNTFRKSTLENYHKRFARLLKSLQEGSFKRYSADKKNILLSTLARHERRLTHWGIACASGAVLLQPTQSLHAQTPLPVGAEFRVNTYTTNSQYVPAIAMDSDGDFVVTWSSLGQDASSDGIYAQRFDASGNPQDAEFRVNTYTTNSQYVPAIAMDSDGNFVVVWESSDQDGSGRGIYARRYDNIGMPLSAEFRVNTNTTFDQRYPNVAMANDGVFVVTWHSAGQDGSSYGIFGQRYEAIGNPLGAEFRVNTYTDGSQLFPSVAMDNDGDFVVVWYSDGQDGSDGGIYAQRYNNTGIPQGVEFKVNTYTTNSQGFPSIAIDNNGNFVVTWGSNGQDGSGGGIYAQRFDNAGIPLSTEFKVNTYTTSDQYNPAIVMDGDGNFVVAWNSQSQDGSSYGIYSQRYAPYGMPQGVEYRINTYTTNYQSEPSISIDNDGDIVVAWNSNLQDGSYYGIYAQRYTLPPLLPVELLYFTGQAGASANVLEWATATEKNTAWQIVERSVNGVDDWTEIGRVTGAGNSTTPNYYKISDENPLPQAYYRLVAQDFDGSLQYSEIISLQRPGTELSILQVFPLPAGDEVRLEIYAPVSGIVTISLTDVLGREVLAREYALERGNHQLVLDMHGLPAGRYQLVISDGDRRVTRAVVK